MEDNEEKNTNCGNEKVKDANMNSGHHYKKIKIKPSKTKDDEFFCKSKINIQNPNQIKNKINFNQINPNVNKNEKIEKENDNFMFDDINQQLDEILENIENDGIEEINKKIKQLNEDKNMFNTFVNNNSANKKDFKFKKLDINNNINNKFSNKRKTNHFYHINNCKNFNRNNRDFLNFYHDKNQNNRYGFNNINNTQRNWMEENNCNNDDCDNYMNRTNISLFYKYNKYCSKKDKDDEDMI